jgi:CBS domain containing-hemolysin-like protein
MNSLGVLALAILTVGLSAVFSGLETGIYRLSRLRLRLGAEKGRLRYVWLNRAVHDGPSLLLSLLVANNLANYAATSSVTYLFLAMVSSPRAAELLATSVTAPLLFVLAESMPKNVFLYRADVLTAFFAPLLYLTHRALTMCGIVPLLRLLAHLFGRVIGSPLTSPTMMTSAQKHQVRAILRDTQEEGLLSRVQTEIVDRIVSVPGLRISAVMVPLARVQAVPVQSGRTALLHKLQRHALTRLLVWEGTPANVVGFVNAYDALSQEEDFDRLDRFVKPIQPLDGATSVIDAIDIMRRGELKIVLVTRARRGGRQAPIGIVTMKDLVEELLGELAEW